MITSASKASQPRSHQIQPSLQFIIVGAYLLSVALRAAPPSYPVPGSVDLGFFYYILAAVFIVGMVNAVNFTDGIDGLNTSVTLVVALVFLCYRDAFKSRGAFHFTRRPSSVR